MLGDLLGRLERRRASSRCRAPRATGATAAAPVARQDDQIEPALAQRGDHRDGVRPQRLTDGEHAPRPAWREGDDGRAGLMRRIASVRDAAEGGAAEPRLARRR